MPKPALTQQEAEMMKRLRLAKGVSPKADIAHSDEDTKVLASLVKKGYVAVDCALDVKSLAMWVAHLDSKGAPLSAYPGLPKRELCRNAQEYEAVVERLWNSCKELGRLGLLDIAMTSNDVVKVRPSKLLLS